MSNKSNEPDIPPLSAKILFSYSFLAVPAAAVGLPLGVYLPAFYADDLGMGLASVGFIFTIAKLWDVITDPIMGSLIDRFPSKWGRYKHWIVIATPILLCATYFVFMPTTGKHSPSYLLAWLIVLYVGYTILVIAHNAWGTDLAASYHERSRLFGWREIVTIFGVVTVLALPAFIEYNGGDTFSKIASMGWFVIILLPIASAMILRAVPERKQHQPSQISFKSIGQTIKNNKPLRLLLIADFTASLAFGAVASTYIFIATWIFDMADKASLMLLLYFLSGLLAIPLWIRISYRIGKHRTLIAAMIYAGIALLGFAVAAAIGTPFALGVATMLFGASFGVPPMVVRAMMADISDYDQLQTGTQRSGLLFAFMTTTTKIGGALSVSVIYAILSLIGFDPAAEINSDSAKNGLMAAYIVVPSILFIIATIALRNYPLDEKAHAEIRKALDNK